MVDFKEKCRIFYIVKGHLPNTQTIEDCYDTYFKRLWGNNEIYYREKGFEECYRVFLMGGEIGSTGTIKATGETGAQATLIARKQ